MGCGRISAESNSTALDVGTRDVNLHSGHIGGRRDYLADPDVVLGGVTGDVCDDGQVREVLSQPRQLLGHDDVEARILQADGVEHAPGVSATRITGLPRRGSRVVALTMIDPSTDRS